MKSSLVLVLAVPLVALAAAGCRRDPPPAPSVATTTAAPASTGTAATTSSPASGAVSAVANQPAPEAPAKPIGTYEQSADGVTRMTIGGLEIEVAADVPERAKDAPKVVDGDNQVVITLRGWPIQARDGRIYVAGKSFGDAPAGSRVRITKEGVHVGGELRGPLP